MMMMMMIMMMIVIMIIVTMVIFVIILIFMTTTFLRRKPDALQFTRVFAGRSSRAHRREGRHFYSGDERRPRAGSGSHHRRRSLRRRKRVGVIPLANFYFLELICSFMFSS
jgi:type IV secretory pathway VirB3-like protein